MSNDTSILKNAGEICINGSPKMIQKNIFVENSRDFWGNLLLRSKLRRWVNYQPNRKELEYTTTTCNKCFTRIKCRLTSTTNISRKPCPPSLCGWDLNPATSSLNWTPVYMEPCAKYHRNSKISSRKPMSKYMSCLSLIKFLNWELNICQNWSELKELLLFEPRSSVSWKRPCTNVSGAASPKAPTSFTKKKQSTTAHADPASQQAPSSSKKWNQSTEISKN